MHTQYYQKKTEGIILLVHQRHWFKLLC